MLTHVIKYLINMNKIVNRKANYEYHNIKEYIAGIQLLGSEVKSLRKGECNITEAYCYIINNEVFLKNMYIARHDQSLINHEEKRDRKLLLSKKEIRDISKMVRENGITLIPLELFTKQGLFKFKISVVKGKKDFDKRNSLREKDAKREMEKSLK